MKDTGNSKIPQPWPILPLPLSWLFPLASPHTSLLPFRPPLPLLTLLACRNVWRVQMKLIGFKSRSIQPPHGVLLCEVGLAQTRQNLLQDRELLCCQFLPIWSLASYTQCYMESNRCTDPIINTTLPHTSTTQQAFFLQWFIQYICTTFRAGRQMCCLSASRAHAKAARLGWVWLKSGLGNPLSRLLHAEMLMKLLLQ